MKRITYLLFLLPLLSLGQSTNAPGLVFPLVEEFIAEAHERDIPVYYEIRKIDSIALAQLQYPITGLHTRVGDTHTIQMHEAYSHSGRRIEKTFYHEVGHVFGLPHSDNSRSIMYSGTYSKWFEKPENWKTAKDKFFYSLKSTP